MLTALLVIGGIGILLLLISFVAGEALDGALESIGPDFLSGLAVAGFLAAFGFAPLGRAPLAAFNRSNGADPLGHGLPEPGPDPAIRSIWARISSIWRRISSIAGSAEGCAAGAAWAGASPSARP